MKRCYSNRWKPAWVVKEREYVQCVKCKSIIILDKKAGTQRLVDVDGSVVLRYPKWHVWGKHDMSRTWLTED